MSRKNQLFEFFILCLKTKEIVYKVKMYVPEILPFLSDEDAKQFMSLYQKVDYESEKYNPVPYNLTRMRNFMIKMKDKYCSDEE